MRRQESIAPRSRMTLNRGLLRENAELISIMLPALVLIFIFLYIPIYGVVIAFQDYMPGKPFFAADTQWVGLKHFLTFCNSKYFVRLIRNTVHLSLYNIVFGFWVPIVFALLLNEITSKRFKKTAQTISYLPYFISTVVVAGMVISFIQSDGLINSIVEFLGGKRVALRGQKSAFPYIYTLTNIWKSFGFNSILYISAITAIDGTLYEAAMLDGAGRMQKMWHVTLPCIKPTIAIMLIMAVGSVMNSNTDLILLLYTSTTYETSDVIGTYIYRVGLQGGKFSYTAAIGLFATVINFVFVTAANCLSNRLTETGLW